VFDTVHEFVFVVKVSKFCNLRCAYCYEYRELHDRKRMSVQTLQNLLANVDTFGEQLRGFGPSPRFSFVWHGGEPLLLPVDYYRCIFELQKKYIQNFAYRNSVQTNLSGSNKGALNFVLDAGWELGVSIDFAEGIRTNAGGRDSNKSVMRAAEELRKSGARFGAISVLGTHNRDLLPDAYDWVSEFADGWRILPAFDGGPEENMPRLRLAEEDVVRVFLEVFQRRANAKKHIPIAPIDDYIRAAALKIVGERTNGDVIRPLLDNIFVVNVNGDVFTRPFAYEPKRCLGNINRASMTDIVQGESYRSCQSAIQQRKIRNCANCESVGFCNSAPMHEHGSVSNEADGERCLVPRRAIQEIENELLDAGIDRSVIGDWARERLAGG
jgi:uncharacterized protein